MIPILPRLSPKTWFKKIMLKFFFLSFIISFKKWFQPFWTSLQRLNLKEIVLNLFQSIFRYFYKKIISTLLFISPRVENLCNWMHKTIFDVINKYKMNWCWWGYDCDTSGGDRRWWRCKALQRFDFEKLYWVWILLSFVKNYGDDEDTITIHQVLTGGDEGAKYWQLYCIEFYSVHLLSKNSQFKICWWWG